jgi:quercetin dioxygenase-like cupin family protein
MKRMAGLLVVSLAVGIAMGMVGSHMLNAQPQPVTRTILQQHDLEGAAGNEVIMYRAEVAPGGMAGRHFHPGPELIYVLEGTLMLEPDGQPPMTLKAGESAHMPAKHIHNAKHAGTTGPTKVLVFLVGEKGQPLATPVQ